MVTKGQILQDPTSVRSLEYLGPLCQVHRGRKWWLAGGKKREFLLKGHSVSVWEDGKRSGGGCAPAGLCLMPPSCTLQNGEDAKFYVYFSTVLKIKNKKLSTSEISFWGDRNEWKCSERALW